MLLVRHEADGSGSPHLLISQLSRPLVEVDVGLPQDDMGITSANTLRWEQVGTPMSFTHNTMWMRQNLKDTFTPKTSLSLKHHGEAVSPSTWILHVKLGDNLTLMAVMAKAIFRRPSMFVLRTRRMCWNFSGMTRDWKTDRVQSSELLSGEALKMCRNTSAANSVETQSASDLTQLEEPLQNK